MFRVSNPSDVENGAWLNPKTTLAVPPSLLILHEPSAYFLSEETGNTDSCAPSFSNPGTVQTILQRSKWTLSSYMALVTHALSSVTFLSGSGVANTCDYYLTSK